MPARSDVHYFGAGPAPLPTEVLEEATKVLLNYDNTGIGITEISHRSSEATAILSRTKNALRRLLDIPDIDGPDGYEILFLQGGGSGEFSAAVYHMVGIYISHLQKTHGDIAALEDAKQHMKLDYLVTGSWSLKASQEAAKLIGKQHVNIATDSRQDSSDKSFGSIPDQDSWSLSPRDKCAMVYYCDNETVDGVEFPSFPSCLKGRSDNVVADMSSNFLSRKIDVRNYAAIFAGAQKNVGTTGITIAIVKKALLPPHRTMADPDTLRKLQLSVGPVVLDWSTTAKNDSLYNTLPIFDVWVAGKVMERLLSKSISAGNEPPLNTQEQESNHKASIIYRALETWPAIYHIVPHTSARSRMNICFRVGATGSDHEKSFLAAAAAQNLLGCKGHRSVGGCRISNCKRAVMLYLDELTIRQTMQYHYRALKRWLPC